MTSPRRFEQDLPALLADLYLAGTPDYRDDLVQRFVTTRQRPAWTFPERWLPMDIATTRVPVARMPRRTLAVLAVLAVLIAAMLSVYLGSQRHLPAPFGPANNGAIVYAADGDIFSADPLSGTTIAIVTGPETDREPVLSRDGTHIAFERRVADEGGPGLLFVARVDGGELTQVTPEPIHLTESPTGERWPTYAFSPDGGSLLIASSLTGLWIASSDGTGVRRLDVGMEAYEPPFRPPDGAEILFVGLNAGIRGLYAMQLSGGAVRTIVAPRDGVELAGAKWSPDGSELSYWSWTPADTITARGHVVAADGTRDRMLFDENRFWDAGQAWSNDGAKILALRGYTGMYEDVRAVILPANGIGSALRVAYPDTIQGGSVWEWAPDDAMILGTPTDAAGLPVQQVIVDSSTGQVRQAPWSTNSDPTWQRVAP